MSTCTVRAAQICFALVAGSSAAHAQAWTPEAKNLSLDLSYQLGYASRTENVDVSVMHHYLVPAVDFGITDHLAISATLPVIAVSCPDCPTLDGGSRAHGAYDDGEYHFTPTDARVTLRYMLPLGFMRVTPQIGASTPVRGYEWAGAASAGRHLKAAYAGLNLGFDLDAVIPRTALQLTYELALVEKFTLGGPEAEARGQNYSAFAAQIAHQIGRVQLHVGADYHYKHGGIAFDEFGMLTPAERLNHDAILRERILLLGAGLGFALGDHTTLYAAARVFASGENTANTSSFELGASWDLDL